MSKSNCKTAKNENIGCTCQPPAECPAVKLDRSSLNTRTDRCDPGKCKEECEKIIEILRQRRSELFAFEGMQIERHLILNPDLLFTVQR